MSRQEAVVMIERFTTCFPFARLLIGLCLVSGVLWANVVGATDPTDPRSWTVQRQDSIQSTTESHDPDLELILDDGTREADIGFGANEASQFMWFNQFSRPPSLAIDLQEISVLFPPGPEIMPGNEIQLVVYLDPDGDPSNGAELLATFDGLEMEVVDGTTFSVYPLDPPVRIGGPGDVLVGVVNRFVENGVSPPSRPAALDTNSSQGRSWVAVWSGDPPFSPDLPPDLFLDTIDFLEPGNWMIRAVATPAPIVDVPVLDRVGLLVLMVTIGGAAFFLMRRRSSLQGR